MAGKQAGHTASTVSAPALVSSQAMRDLVIGLDFDNTLIDYDQLFVELALEAGLTGIRPAMTKRELRDTVRLLPDGDIEWQKLQAMAYGLMIGRAKVARGATEFIAKCRQHGTSLKIISHKTRRAAHDPAQCDLWQTAMEFMRRHRFFDPEGLGFQGLDVFFEVTRQDKVRRITSLGCHIFVDDLEETFAEPGFPPGVMKVLFAARGPFTGRDLVVARSWQEAGDVIFGSGR